MELRNSDLVRWNTEYVHNMTQAAISTQNHRAPFIAKKNAVYWVEGSGIGDVGSGIGASRMEGPLSMFSGRQLLEALMEPSQAIAGEKRPHEGEEEDEARRVRAREDTDVEVGRSSGEEHGRGAGLDVDDGFAPIVDDQVTSCILIPATVVAKDVRISKSAVTLHRRSKNPPQPCLGTSAPPSAAPPLRVAAQALEASLACLPARADLALHIQLP